MLRNGHRERLIFAHAEIMPERRFQRSFLRCIRFQCGTVRVRRKGHRLRRAALPLFLCPLPHLRDQNGLCVLTVFPEQGVLRLNDSLLHFALFVCPFDMHTVYTAGHALPSDINICLVGVGEGDPCAVKTGVPYTVKDRTLHILHREQNAEQTEPDRDHSRDEALNVIRTEQHCHPVTSDI